MMQFDLKKNPYYWLYRITRKQIENNKDLCPSKYYWNRWLVQYLTEDEKNHCMYKHDDYEQQIKVKDIKPISTYSIYEKFKELPDYEDSEFTYSKGDINFGKTRWKEDVNFTNFLFTKNTNFFDVNFEKNVTFENIIFFDEVDFGEITLNQNTYFKKIKFLKTVYFDDNRNNNEKTFKNNINITEVDFNSHTYFNGVHFNYIRIDKTNFYDWVTFENAEFKDSIKLTDTVFRNKTNFKRTKFFDSVNFSEVVFDGETDFSYAEFGSENKPIEINFWRAMFNNNVFHTETKFHAAKIHYKNAKFFGDAIGFVETEWKIHTDNSQIEKKENENFFNFENTIFKTEVNFQQAKFYSLPDMTGTDFRGGINLDKVKFPPHLSNDICGGLSEKDAAITWHSLQMEMEKGGYHEQAVEYFGYELEAKRLNKDNDIFFRIALWIYKHLSNYGYSIVRPIVAWLIGIAVFWLIYYFLLQGAAYLLLVFTPIVVILFSSNYIFSQKENFKLKPIVTIFTISIIIMLSFSHQSFNLSLKGAVPLIADNTTYYDRLFVDPKTPSETQNEAQNQSREPIPFNNSLELYWFPFLQGLHTIFSFLCLFLLGLAIRNRLRLR